MNTITKYIFRIRSSHTIAALPFALIGYVYAMTSTGMYFDWLLLAEIIFCMVFARNTAIGFNRWTDRKIDAENSGFETRNKIPSGQISARAAILFGIANAVGFIIIAYFINPLAFALSPVALFIITGYSLTKRFTAWSHVILGTALAIAPIGTYIAVTGTIAAVPIILAGVVITWIGGFDILYSLRNIDFERKHHLYSASARFSTAGTIWISIILHLITLYAVVILGIYTGMGWLYWIGTALFSGLLVLQHIFSLPSRIESKGDPLRWINEFAGIVYAAFAITELLWR